MKWNEAEKSRGSKKWGGEEGIYAQKSMFFAFDFSVLGFVKEYLPRIRAQIWKRSAQDAPKMGCENGKVFFREPLGLTCAELHQVLSTFSCREGRGDPIALYGVAVMFFQEVNLLLCFHTFCNDFQSKGFA